MEHKNKKRTKAEIETLVENAKKLLEKGMPITRAAEEVGIGYPTLKKYVSPSAKRFNGGDKVDVLFKQIRSTMETQIRKEILARI